jgi:site-specific DNA recombinase
LQHHSNTAQELQELTARMARLRERLRRGDPDMQPDELQAAINRAEAKREELENQQPAAKAAAKVLSILRRAAEIYRR